MKKLYTVLITLLFAVLLCVPARAAADAFQEDFFPGGTIETPSRGPYLGIHDHYEYGDQDNTHIDFFYFMTDDMLKMCEALSRSFEEGKDILYEKYHFSSFDPLIQVDVKFNDEDWINASANLDEREYADDYIGRDLQLIFENDIYTGSVSQLRSFTQSWLVYHDGDNFLTPYLKKVKAGDDHVWQFDLKDGSMTYRYRFVVEYAMDGTEGKKVLRSGWSPEVTVGKNANMKEPEPTKTAAPVLSEFSLDVDSNGLAKAHYYMTVPDSVFDNYLYYALRDEAFEMYGFEGQIRVNDGDWTDVDVWDPRSLWSGFRVAAHENLTSVNDKVELRIRLVSDKEEVGDSGWSNVVGNVAAEGEQHTTEAASSAAASPETKAPAKPEDTKKSECKLCHICPVQPLGICLFVWIGIILLVIVVLILIGKGKKKNKE